MFYQNVQYLPTREDQLEFALDELKPDILALSEHGMRDDELANLNIKGYKISSYFCREKTSRGGSHDISEE